MVQELNSDQKFGFIILICCALIWFLIPSQVQGVKASIYPRFVTIWITISCIAMVILSRKDAPKKVWYGSKEIIQVIIVAIVCLIYSLGIDFIGFYTSSFLFLIIAMSSFGIRNWKILILILPSFMIFIYFLIEKLLNFTLPKGRFF